jgi:hypothetical protein
MKVLGWCGKLDPSARRQRAGYCYGLLPKVSTKPNISSIFVCVFRKQTYLLPYPCERTAITPFLYPWNFQKLQEDGIFSINR